MKGTFAQKPEGGKKKAVKLWGEEHSGQREKHMQNLRVGTRPVCSGHSNEDGKNEQIGEEK